MRTWQDAITANQERAAQCYRYAEILRTQYERRRYNSTARAATKRLYTQTMQRHSMYARDARALLIEWLGE